jgi:6-phosphogluconate dehydrogenase
MKIGMIGLGRMGSAMVLRLLENDHRCAIYDSDADNYPELVAAGASSSSTLDELVNNLRPPRVVWIMVPADGVDDVIEPLTNLLDDGDIIVDGGNSHYEKTISRSEKLAGSGISLVDVGTSGGIWGRERGYCLMIGGENDAVEFLGPIFESLSPAQDSVPETRGANDHKGTSEQGYLHCGQCGAGHFTKMVHNGIEYGMMAAYAEGFEILNKVGEANEGQDSTAVFPRYYADPAQVAELWRRGSVVGSWLLDLTAQSLHSDPALKEYSGHVSDSGEGRWTVETATKLGVPAYVLSAALFGRFSSQGEGTFGNKVLSAMRMAFGGHKEPG